MIKGDSIEDVFVKRDEIDEGRAFGHERVEARQIARGPRVARIKHYRLYAPCNCLVYRIGNLVISRMRRIEMARKTDPVEIVLGHPFKALGDCPSRTDEEGRGAPTRLALAVHPIKPPERNRDH